MPNRIDDFLPVSISILTFETEEDEITLNKFSSFLPFLPKTHPSAEKPSLFNRSFAYQTREMKKTMDSQAENIEKIASQLEKLLNSFEEHCNQFILPFEFADFLKDIGLDKLEEQNDNIDYVASVLESTLGPETYKMVSSYFINLQPWQDKANKIRPGVDLISDVVKLLIINQAQKELKKIKKAYACDSHHEKMQACQQQINRLEKTFQSKKKKLQKNIQKSSLKLAKNGLTHDYSLSLINYLTNASKSHIQIALKGTSRLLKDVITLRDHEYDLSLLKEWQTKLQPFSQDKVIGLYQAREKIFKEKVDHAVLEIEQFCHDVMPLNFNEIQNELKKRHLSLEDIRQAPKTLAEWNQKVNDATFIRSLAKQLVENEEAVAEKERTKALLCLKGTLALGSKQLELNQGFVKFKKFESIVSIGLLILQAALFLPYISSLTISKYLLNVLSKSLPFPYLNFLPVIFPSVNTTVSGAVMMGIGFAYAYYKQPATHGLKSLEIQVLIKGHEIFYTFLEYLYTAKKLILELNIQLVARVVLRKNDFEYSEMGGESYQQTRNEITHIQQKRMNKILELQNSFKQLQFNDFNRFVRSSENGASEEKPYNYMKELIEGLASTDFSHFPPEVLRSYSLQTGINFGSQDKKQLEMEMETFFTLDSERQVAFYKRLRPYQE